MTVDKRMSYVNQDGYKNYTKNSDSVTVPRKFKSRANATPTKLAYITAAEEKQLKKQNPGTPHKGPKGIPSYDDFDAQGNYRSGAAMSAAESGKHTSDTLAAGISNQELQAIRAAAINAGAGQRVNPGFFDSKHTISPAELAMAKAYRKDPANKYAKQAYRNTRGGLMNFIQGGGLLGNLVSGLGSFFGLGKRYDEPTYDMSEGNTLGLYNERVNPTYYNDLGNEFALGTTPTPSGPFKYGVGPQEVNLPGPYEQAESDYWSDKQVINTPGGEIVIDSQGNEVVDTPMGTPWDNPYQEPKKGIMERISDFFFTPAGAAEVKLAPQYENTPWGPFPTGEIGLTTSGKLGNLTATIDALEALKGEPIDPQFNYSGTFDNTLLGGQTNLYGNYGDDVQNLGLNFTNDKGLSGGISYDAITGEPRFDIGFRKNFADGGLSSLFTRRR